MKKVWKKKIDERQQAELNRVTSTGYWIAFYLLLASILWQSVITNRPFTEWKAEWLIFMILAVYEVIQCIRIGVWTEFNQTPTVKSILISSAVGSGIFALIFTIGTWTGLEADHRSLPGILAVFAWDFFLLFAILLVAFLVIGKIFNGRKKKLEQSMDAEMEEENENE